MRKQQVSTFVGKDRLLSTSSSSVYAESQTTQYDGYQQAWRLVGYFVDCGQNASSNNDDNEDGSSSCPRYLLWGAYIDPKYKGGGVNEYQYYQNGKYNAAACTDDSRCAKMDCHEKNTNFQLIGVFKQAYYASEWFPTLLKHQCVLDDDTYQTITTQESQWPEGCVATGLYEDAENGSAIQFYLDLQSSVTLQLAIYIDSSCKVEYTGGKNVSMDVMAAAVGLPTSEQTTAWNQALEQFYYCQPCMSLDLRTTENQGRELNDDIPFACYDNAGDVNVNQCASFRANTQMNAASWHDLDIAAKQGGLAMITLGDRTLGIPLSQISMASTSAVQKNTPSGLLGLVFGGIVFVLSAAFLIMTINWKLEKLRRRTKEEQHRVLAEPLVTELIAPPQIKTMASF